MSKRFWFWIALLAILVTTAGIVKFTSLEYSLLESVRGGSNLVLPLIFIAGVIDSANPCAFSILLLTIAFLFSLGKNKEAVLKTGASYIFGIFIVYILIGLGLLKALQFFDIPHSMAKLGAVVIIVFGFINIINEYFPNFPIKLKIPQSAHERIAQLMEKASVPAAFFLGIVVGMYEFPCTGGPYLLVLGLLHDEATYLSGFAYLIFYNIIFVLPLVITLGIASNKDLLEKARRFRAEKMSKVRFGEGLAMILLGLLIFII